MSGATFPALISSWLAALLSLSMAAYAWLRQNESNLTRPLIVYSLGVVVWCTAYSFELIAPSLAAKLLWGNLQFLGVLLLPPAFLVFVLRFTDRERKIKPSLLVLLSLQPLISALLLAADFSFHLVRIDPHLDLVDGFPTLRFTYGPWYLTSAIYVLLATLVSGMLLFKKILRSSGNRIRQIGILLLAVLMPGGVYTLQVTGLIPELPINLLALSFTFTNLALAWAVFGYHLLDISPVAQAQLVELVQDGMIVVEPGGLVAFLNPAAQKILGILPKGSLGKPASAILPAPIPDQLEAYKKRDQIISSSEASFDAAPGKTYRIGIAPLNIYQHLNAAWLITLSDITAIRSADMQIRILYESEREARQMAEALQEVSRQMNATLDLGKLQEALLDLVARVVPYDLGMYMSRQGDGLRVTSTRVKPNTGEITPRPITDLSLSPADIPFLNQMLSSKTELAIADISQVSGWEKMELSAQVRSWVGAPVIYQDEVLGLISLEKFETGFYNESHANRLAALASQVALAYQNSSLYTDLNESLEREQRLNLVSRTISNQAHDLDGMLNQLLRLTADLVSADASILGLLTPDEKAIDFQYLYNLPEQPFKSKLAEGRGLAWKVISTRQAVLIKDYASSTEALPEVQDTLHVYSLLGIPILSGDDCLGTIAFYRLQAGEPFRERDLALGESIGRQAGIAIQNARLYQETRQHLTEQSILVEMGRLLTSALDLEDLLDMTYRQVARALDTDSFYIASYSEETEMWETLLDVENGEKIPLVKESLNTGLTGWIIRTHQPLLLNSSQELIDFGDKNQIRIVGRMAHSWMGVPLIAGERVLGVMGTQHFELAGLYSQHNLEFFTAIGSQVAVALQNAQLFEAAERRARESETLREAGSAIAGTLNQKEAVRRILEQLARVVPYDSASVQLLQSDYLEIRGGLGFKDIEQVLGLRFRVDAGGPQSIVFARRQPFILEDAQEDFPAFRKSPHNHIHGWMGIPLIVKDRMIGMIALDSMQKGRFSQDHARLAEAFADQVALLLENARLYEEAQRLAVTDPLTGLYNRRHFFDLARLEFKRARRYRHPLSIIMIDTDHFKNVNDSYGHASGDRVLQHLASLFRGTLREYDVVGRYGGEEFIILLPQISSEGAEITGERLRKSVADTPYEEHGKSISTTISLGVATLEQTDRTDQERIHSLDDLINLADRALYLSKQNGRNQVTVWRPVTANPETEELPKR